MSESFTTTLIFHQDFLLNYSLCFSLFALFLFLYSRFVVIKIYIISKKANKNTLHLHQANLFKMNVKKVL